MIHCDIGRCVGCRICEVVCGERHFGAVSPALARIRVAKLEEIGIDMAVSCVSCEEKPCLDCPVDALSNGEGGRIVLADELCTGCGECVDNCPVGAIGFHDGLPLFCDLCDGSPACVDNCPTGALVDELDMRLSLEPFMQNTGSPARKRADFVMVAARPVRESWEKGKRVDS